MTTNLGNTDQSLARMRLGGGFAWELMGVSKDPRGNQEDAQQDTGRSSATGHDAMHYAADRTKRMELSSYTKSIHQPRLQTVVHQQRKPFLNAIKGDNTEGDRVGIPRMNEVSRGDTMSAGKEAYSHARPGKVGTVRNG